MMMMTGGHRDMWKSLSRGVQWLENVVDARKNETNIGSVMRIDEPVMEKSGTKGERLEETLKLSLGVTFNKKKFLDKARSNGSCALQRNGIDLRMMMMTGGHRDMWKSLSRGVQWLENVVDARKNETNIGSVMRIDEPVMEKSGTKVEIGS
ncbi:hypothetical protein V8G54_010107 [Vigna mungo]|uniref:Uncharacterized protein n=1 Tax=Vigna mungo TaxID=3915 RepID=A0AAQ3NXF0_VIGMU